ncbi:MAG: TraR/DksA C4-type zinc finger protein [Candidatus Rokubacteria bacterium]|nr:TraR/DksA C4-type zinc finger protein [Candidatus Rokubacteria bacterium]
MAVAGCREIGIATPKTAGKRLVVFAEIDRCATDAIQALTGVSVGKRTLKHVDYGKMAATFVDVERGTAMRVVARDDARAHAPEWAPGVVGERDTQITAYRAMPEEALLSIMPVKILAGWLDRRRVRVFCDSCGEGINYEREVSSAGRTLCRPCAGDAYYAPNR